MLSVEGVNVIQWGGCSPQWRTEWRRRWRSIHPIYGIGMVGEEEEDDVSMVFQLVHHGVRGRVGRVVVVARTRWS